MKLYSRPEAREILFLVTFAVRYAENEWTGKVKWIPTPFQPVLVRVAGKYIGGGPTIMNVGAQYPYINVHTTKFSSNALTKS